ARPAPFVCGSDAAGVNPRVAAPTRSTTTSRIEPVVPYCLRDTPGPTGRRNPMGKGASPEQVIREIHRRTRRRFSAEEKVRIVLGGLRGEQSVAELCRREGLAPNLYYRWSKEFLEAGKKRLLGDTTREATAPEVKALRDENGRLKQVLAETVLENRLL